MGVQSKVRRRAIAFRHRMEPARLVLTDKDGTKHFEFKCHECGSGVRVTKQQDSVAHAEVSNRLMMFCKGKSDGQQESAG